MIGCATGPRPPSLIVCFIPHRAPEPAFKVIPTCCPQVRKYQQAQQLRTSVSASQAALQQLARELGSAEGGAGSAVPAPPVGGAHWPAPLGPNRDEPPAWQRHGDYAPPSGHSAAGLGGSSTADAAAVAAAGDPWQGQWGKECLSPPEPEHAGSGPASSLQRLPSLPPTDPSDLRAAYHGTSPAANSALPGGVGLGLPGAGGSPGHNGHSGLPMGAARAGPDPASGGVVVNLKSDRPFQTAADVERRQRQQADFKVCGLAWAGLAGEGWFFVFLVQDARGRSGHGGAGVATECGANSCHAVFFISTC